MLILLLFALAGSLESTSFRCDVQNIQPALTRSTLADSPAAVRNYLSAAICSCEASVEAPVFSHGHKAVVRQLADARVVAAAACNVHTAIRTRPEGLPPDAVDYYIFTLGRILI